MVCNYVCVNLAFVVFSAALISRCFGFTDPADVTALQDLYRTLNNPLALKGWNGNDPCEESWTGIACSGSSVIHIQIQRLNLTGHLGSLLNNLQNLKQLDVSFNNILGEIPQGLPPNATHLNMACNYFSENIPHSLSTMTKLAHLNLSHNFLYGPIGNVFTGLYNLREMDLSYNNFTGDLPSSFGSLTTLDRLFLQNNRFTGSVTYLAELPLTDLNIQDNLFSGLLPPHFQSIPNLWIGGNKFQTVDNSPPWAFPLDNVPLEQNTSRPPITQANAIENYAPIKFCKSVSIFDRAFLFVSTFTEDSTTAIDESLQIPPYNAASVLGPKRLTSQPHKRTGETSRKSFSGRDRFNGRIKVYTVAEVQLVTNSFHEENLLGEGSLGPVYRAEFPNNKVLAVKNINMAGMSFSEEEKFLDVVSTASRLKHPNIVSLKGYCLEHGQHLLVFEYVRNLTLDDALHSTAYKPLSWGTRLRIALGVGRALDYLHSTFSPPVAHGKLKATNVLLDENLMPCVTDCGLAILRPLISSKAKNRASEIDIRDTGYSSPDHGQPGVGSTKSDIFAFGVLLLELLTGRKPFDGSRPREEHYLAKWASSRLHDSDSLEQMVDPAIKRTFSSKALSRYADIISLCIQPVKQFRPPMSEIVDNLVSFSQKLVSESGEADETELDPLDMSFHTTISRFNGSPALSYVSA
ncbi:protein STRUBBELIG-RECEPTOR FAMILY 2 [Vigna radiata var. radiata]|uniref:Protein STRUBBELIG-RECEPTOR FAMILY 2 n=1 Tax=Vigna radiata var. radiata TaxID=3916 RepID=A0A3Q0FCD3_VIGRR|nr:protein STRUBBELIG-RECEPTOR FAMILY 2 [Vigna radiata var. radiata]